MTAETNKLVMRRFLEFINTAARSLLRNSSHSTRYFMFRDAPSRCAALLATSLSSG